MTAASFAELVNARRIGPGKWQARCPAHDDSSPSLSIAAGTDGRILLRCWVGCATAEIVKALGISLRDLFAGEPATPQQIALLSAERQARDELERQQRTTDRAKRDRVFKLENLRDSIGAKLARSPNDDKLAELFHEVCDRLHDAEMELPCHEDGPWRGEPLPQSPSWIPGALVELGRNFDEGKGPLDAGLERTT